MEGIADSLITWIKTFKVEASHSTAAELSDGVALAQVLAQIAPDYFNPIWLSKLKTASPDNWRLRQSNLKKVLKGILDYNMEILGQQIMDFQIPNINEIAEKQDPTQLARLLQLILGCAVNCAKKQVYIEAILELEENVQQVVMNAIQELIMTEVPTAVAPDSYLELNEQVKKTTRDLQIANDAREQITARCHELDMQVAILQEEKNTLMIENEKLNEKLNHIESLEDPSTMAGRRFQQMQHKLNILQDEVFNLETTRDEYKSKAEIMEKEIIDLQSKNEEFGKASEVVRALRDELDVLKHKADKVEMYENTIESYKKKLSDQSDLKRQIKKLEEKNSFYVEKNLELEEELKKSSLLKSQMETFKKQTQELNSKLFEETRKADKSKFEAKRFSEKLDALQKEKDRLISERNTMRETIEELKCVQVQFETEEMRGGNGTKRAEGSISDVDVIDGVNPEIKEKLIRLTHENMKLRQNTADEQQLTFLQALLDDTKSRLSEVETENRLANQRIMELEGNLQDLQENQSASDTSVGADLRKQMGMLARKLEEAELEIERKKTSLERAESDSADKDQKMASLRELLVRKEEEVKDLLEKNERYKKCVEKAKHVMKNIDQNESPDIMVLKNQLHEKEKLIANFERESQKEAAMREYESQLITSAFYNMGAQLQRRTVEERMRQISPQPQTFLSRQRQATSKRLNLPGVATRLWKR